MKEKKKAGKCSVLGKWILCMLLAGCMLFTIGCGKSAQSSADSGATNHSESGFGVFRADNQKTASDREIQRKRLPRTGDRKGTAAFGDGTFPASGK